MTESYPLNWPMGYKRTQREKRKESKFSQTPQTVQDAIRHQVKLLGGTGLIISANAMLRNDGFMYSDQMKDRVADPGVAIYFTFEKKQISMCCDYYLRIWENLYALAVSIEALRTISRHQVSEFLARSFAGFNALPAPYELVRKSIWQTLGLPARPDDKSMVEAAYKVRVKKTHPDTEGGSKEAFQELQEAYEQAMETYE